jgi:uncharacterized protein YndB with AHSA1/START domain
VGSDRTLSADANFPAAGTKFEVQVAGGAQDETEVREVFPPRKIVLYAAARWLGPARVTIELAAANGGTEVTIIEDPAGKLSPLRFAPLVQLAIKLRNVESLRRFRRLVESRS